jgi:uncharacterized protein YdhG (YjbR/CyaY superfamily)
MKNPRSQPRNIDEYIADFPAEIQSVLEKIRSTIRKAAPDAEEKIGYQMPTFTLSGNLVHFAAFKKHIGLFPPVKGDEKLQIDIAPYKGAKGNLQFPLDKPIPYTLISRIVKCRVKEQLERAQSKQKPKKKQQPWRNLPMRHARYLRYSSAIAFVPALIVVSLVGGFVTGQESKKQDSAIPKVSASEKVVQEQLDAYNQHDVEAFLKTYSAEIKLYEFPDKEISSGLDAMRKTYGRLFEREPDRKATIAKRIVQGDYVVDHEEVSGGGREFKAVAIYRVKNDKIVTVWFLK